MKNENTKTQKRIIVDAEGIVHFIPEGISTYEYAKQLRA